MAFVDLLDRANHTGVEPDAAVPESAVTQHEAALTVTEAQVSDLSHVDASKLPLTGGALTGAVTTSSTFDGRDVSADGAKLDGIEPLADVTDATNVAAAGSLMDSDVDDVSLELTGGNDLHVRDDGVALAKMAHSAGGVPGTLGYDDAGAPVLIPASVAIGMPIISLGPGVTPAFVALPTAGIGDNAVTASKIADGAVSTQRIADSAVTIGKMADGTPGRWIKYNDGTGALEEVDAPSGVQEYKAPVRAATTIPVSIGSSLENGDTLDGVVLATGNRVLVKDGGIGSIGTYTYDDTAGIPNANGEAQPNQNLGLNVTSINYFNSNAAGADQSAVFANLRVGDLIQLNTLRYVVTAAPTDNTTYWTIPVVYSPSTSETFPVTQPAVFTQGIFNGIYTVNASGAATLGADFASTSGQASAYVPVQEGADNGGRAFVCTNSAGSDVVGTDRIVFEQPRVNAYANGIGAFRPAGETPASNADNGRFNSTPSLSTTGVDALGLRFSGKTYGPNWGFALGSPIKVQSLISGQGGPGAHIILRQQDDPSKVAIYRNNAPPDVIIDGGLNDDTRFNDVTYLGATFTNFDDTKLYELVISPTSPSAVFSGSGMFAVAGTTDFANRWSWPVGTGWQNWAWNDLVLGTSAPTTALYDHTGIVMPADGVVTNFYMQVYLQNGTSLSIKPELTRMRPAEGASTVANTAMNNTAFVEDLIATSGNMNALNLTVDGTGSGQLAETTFQRGDKFLVTAMEMINTGTVLNVRVEWGIKVVFFDPIPIGEAPGD